MKGNVDAEIADPDLDAATIAAPHQHLAPLPPQIVRGRG